MKTMQKKAFDHPDETRQFDNGLIELVTIGGVMFGRCRFEPGWRWSTCVKPIAKTESCEAPHLQYHVSGRMGIQMDDGPYAEFGPGDVSLVPPGHDAWVLGDEAAVVIDISGGLNYARPHHPEPLRAAKRQLRTKAAVIPEMQALLLELEELDRRKKERFDEIDPEDVGIELLQEKQEFQNRRHDLMQRVNDISIKQSGEPYFDTY